MPTRPSTGPDELDFLIRVSWLYYEAGLTQAAIAKRLGVARGRVIRALGEAQRRGLVEIHLTHPQFNCLSLEARVKERFGLSDAVVVPTPPGGAPLKPLLGKAAATYLERHLRPGEVLATAWGETVYEASTALHRRRIEGTAVVMALGGLSSVINAMNPLDVARNMAERLGARCYYLFVPAVVDSEALRDLLMAERSVKQVLDLARSASWLLAGIGEMTEQAALVRAGFLDVVKMAELRAHGAVGDILARFFDEQGRPVAADISRRTIGLDLEDIRAMRRKLVAAGGPQKVEAILGAIRGGYVDILVTDEASAAALIARAEEQAAGPVQVARGDRQAAGVKRVVSSRAG